MKRKTLRICYLLLERPYHRCPLAGLHMIANCILWLDQRNPKFAQRQDRDYDAPRISGWLLNGPAAI
jgi:hypothetical protein